jgi:hypothetical protein
MAKPGLNPGDAPVEGDHPFLAVRMRAFPHDTAVIPATDFDPFVHQVARPHRAPVAPVDPVSPHTDGSGAEEH